MILRDYQARGSDAVYEAWRTHRSIIGIYPTGCGKTILIADIVRRAFPKRSMVIAHREELIWQARDKITRATGLRCEVEMAEYQAARDWASMNRAPVVVSTVQSQCSGNDGGGRMGRFNPWSFGVLIIDEAHHAVSPSYRRLIAYYQQNPELKILGVTATPDRSDKAALKQVFESVAFDYEILDAIEDGWLVEIKQQFVGIHGLDYSRVRTTAGDLNPADLSAVMEAESNLQGIAAASIEVMARRRSLVFTASVRQARMLAEIYNRHEPQMAQFVCGLTPKEERRMILADFANGKTQVVVNCGVLTEGFDDPGVECVVMARATKSRALYAQQVGRCTRPLPGIVETPIDAEARRAAIAASAKPSCLVLDFAGNSGRHKLVTAADILGGDVSEEAIALATFKAKAAGQAVSVSRLLDEAEIEVEQKKRREREEARLAAESRRARLVARAQWTAQNVDPFDMFNLQPAPVSNATGPRLSDKQRDILAKHMGLDATKLPFGHAMQLLREVYRRWEKKLCTFKQAKWLSKHGYDPAEMTMSDASELMDRWAKNGWQRPEGE